MKMYKVIVAPRLLYGNKTWMGIRKYLNKIQSSEIKFLRSVKGCSILDKIKNEEIRKEL